MAVPKNELEKPSYYLPHRGVFKENSTTRFRPVFDASSHEGGSPSLNDCLEKGPNLLEEIPPLLMRFRKDNIGVVSDIRKAFLQISVMKEDCDFLRFLWWENFEDRKLKVFRHRRVVFGLTCSPFLLAAVLDSVLEDSPPDMKETADILKKSFYVDNCVTSVSNKEELEKFIQESRRLLEGACFDLRGWEHTALQEISNLKEPIHVLGILWDKKEDSIFCDLSTVREVKPTATRRSVLSTVQKIFDPLGMLCPVTLQPKLIVQQTWNLKIGWDAELPESHRREFENWTRDLPLLSKVKVPRNLGISNPNAEISLHVFCDASQVAYSAVVFMRKMLDEKISVHFVQAKSRVAPLHKMTIPRLELLACCIGARLVSNITTAMDLNDISITYWSDSSTALCWIKREEHWGVFVNNRVKEIRKLSSKDSWRHVPGEYNPADLPSRCCSVKAFMKSRWWEGPSWLKLEREKWPETEFLTEEAEISKEKKKCITSTLVCSGVEDKWYNRFSEYSKILRICAWMWRFINNSLKRHVQKGKELLISELESAEKKILKVVQQEALNREDLKSLCTFTDSEGLLRLTTKITRRKDDENFLCPIVLPSKHEIVEKIILERHRQTHAGVQSILADIRQQFWLIRGRKTVKRVILRCIRCRRHDAKGVESIPAPLPEDRIRDALVFEIVGVDLAGPLHLKDGKRAWILLFTCAVYRAVHLELIQSLSTNCFLLGLRRFIARRGRPKIVYSDCGSNFVGAENLLKSIDWDKIIVDASVLKIQWKFNPPASPWWGGWWERIVQMVKRLLRRILGRASLAYEEMLTILCDVESVINARPLTYVTEDPNDLLPLSPSMFMQDLRTIGVPDLDRLDKVNLSGRFRYQQNLRETFRKRFREEYLSLLVQRPLKNKHLVRELKVGDIVLVSCDNKKRIDWPMGRIVSTISGKDNCVRVVKVKTANGELTRPVQKVHPLEVYSYDPLFQKKESVDSGSNLNKLEKRESDSDQGLKLIKETKTPRKTKRGRTIVKPKRYND